MQNRFALSPLIPMPFHVANSTPARESAARQYLAGTVRLSLALRLTRADGTQLFFTDAEDDTTLPAGTWGNITIPSATYRAGRALFPKNLQQSPDPRRIDNWEFSAFTAEDESGWVSAADVSRGLYKGARWALLLFARDRLDYQWLRARGKMGDKTLDKGYCQWKMNGLSQPFNQEVLEVTSPLARKGWENPILAALNLNTATTQDGFALRVYGTASAVDAVWNRRRFVIGAAQGWPSSRFCDGTVEFLSGANAGHVASVLDYESGPGRFTLDENTPFPIETGAGVRAKVRAPQTIEEWRLYTGSGFGFPAEPAIPNGDNAQVIHR